MLPSHYFWEEKLEKITKYLPIVGTGFSLIGGWLLLRDRFDRITVSHRKVQTSNGRSLRVVNHSKHMVILEDFGFVNERGRLYSIPEYRDCGAHDGAPPVECLGSCHMEARQHFDATSWDQPCEPVVAAYAYTTTSHRLRLGFFPNISLLKAWFYYRPIILWRWLRR